MKLYVVVWLNNVRLFWVGFWEGLLGIDVLGIGGGIVLY